MKNLILIVILNSFMGFAFGQSSQRSISFQGQETIQSRLQSAEYRIETQVVTVPAVCSRRVWVGGRTVCRPGPGRPICNTRPIYRLERFPCPRQVVRSFEVKDYDVVANVLMNFSVYSDDLPNETVRLNLNGNNFSASMEGSKKFLAYISSKNETSDFQNGVLEKQYVYNVDIIDAKTYLDPLTIKAVDRAPGMLIATLGSGDMSFVKLKLTIKQRKFLRKNPVLIDRELTANEVEFVSLSENDNRAYIDLNKLGIDLETDVRYRIDLVSEFSDSELLLNKNEFRKELKNKFKLKFKL